MLFRTAAADSERLLCSHLSSRDNVSCVSYPARQRLDLLISAAEYLSPRHHVRCSRHSMLLAVYCRQSTTGLGDSLAARTVSDMRVWGRFSAVCQNVRDCTCSRSATSCVHPAFGLIQTSSPLCVRELGMPITDNAHASYGFYG